MKKFLLGAVILAMGLCASASNVILPADLNLLEATSEKEPFYPQLNKSVEGDLSKGGICTYAGVDDDNSIGLSELKVYNLDLDPLTGSPVSGDCLELCVVFAHKPYAKKDYVIEAGTYNNSESFDRNTWYPAFEINSMGIIYPYGTYIRQRENEQWTYGYLKDGEFTIVDNGDGTFKGTFNGTTTLGHSVNVTWSGDIEIIFGEDQYPRHPEEDIEIDFSKLEFGRVYNEGIKGGCRTLIVDLGSPDGEDEGVNMGGDILRLEFLVEPEQTRLNPGVYTVVPQHYSFDELEAGSTYEPGSLNKGYYDNSGHSVGTRYAHFKKNEYCIFDQCSFAEDGTVTVETDDFENYKLTINLINDWESQIKGYWEKPLKYCYSPDAIGGNPDLSGIDDVADDSATPYVAKDGANLVVYNTNGAPVTLYDIEGRLVATTTENHIPLTHFTPGLYILKVGTKVLKLAL